MKTFSNSFLGAVSGTVLVIALLFTFNYYSAGHNGQAAIQKSQAKTIIQNNKIPVQQASYTVPPQSVDLTEAAQKSVNAVVHIKTEMRVRSNSYEYFFGPFRDYFGNPYHENTYVAFGSGVIISPDGYIVTNNHVVDNADKISVTFNDKKELPAEVIGTDPRTDLALIKVDAENLDFLTYGDSDKLKIGEWVLAVGNPFNLTSTVTAGIVSAKARNINILGAQSAIESFIQTDAVVNRGNSGGALVNTQGQLVGINAAIASHTGVYEGYSFAIPANIVKKVVDDLMKYGETQRAYIGVQISDINADFAEEKGLDGTEGVYVAGIVDNSGADEAGIEEGDVIVSIDGTPINSVSELMGSIAQHSPGDVIKVAVNRDDEVKTFDVLLKNQNNTTALVKPEDTFYNKLLGASMQKAPKEDLEKLGVSNGVKVVKIDDGILLRGGITNGFIITEINGKKVQSESSLNDAIETTRNNLVRIKGVYPNGTRVSFEFML